MKRDSMGRIGCQLKKLIYKGNMKEEIGCIAIGNFTLSG